MIALVLHLSQFFRQIRQFLVVVLDEIGEPVYLFECLTFYIQKNPSTVINTKGLGGKRGFGKVLEQIQIHPPVSKCGSSRCLEN